MADQPLLEVNCTNCPGDQACDDCVVRFFLTGRDAAVVPLAGRAVRRALDAGRPALGAELAAGLPADLAAVVALLEAAGMAPEVLSLTVLDSAEVVELDSAARAS